MHSPNAETQKTTTKPMTILVVGAYGLIGCGLVQRLQRDGYTVIGLGRDIATGKRVLPTISWVSADLRSLTQATAWKPLLKNIDAVVNCSGALQDGPEDNLEVVHHYAVAALAEACASENIKIIQISAAGADLNATTPFLASKARGDAAIQAAQGRYCIFRPGLVLARHSYGGTTMLRMLAAFPVVQPIAMPEAKVQSVGLEDISASVSAAIAGAIPNGFVGDLVESEAHDLRELVANMRRWLGFAPARQEIKIPSFLMQAIASVADGLARLGWRSPLRTTAVKVLSRGVTGTPSDLSEFGVPAVKSLSQTLADMPTGVEDRLFARMALLSPVIMVTLVAFWLLSGVIGFLQVDAAALVLVEIGWSQTLAVASVLFWAAVDVAIALGLAYRPYAKLACWCAVGVSLFYLVASTLFVPNLWLDPLGPLVKVLPSIALALVARITLETR